MKTLIVKDNTHDRATQVQAKRTYQTKSGKWVAEVDQGEFDQARNDLCQDIKDCTLDNLHVEADVDDDGTEYTISSR